MKNQKILNQEEAERLIAFSNNSGPLFILGTVGISLLNNSKIGYVLLLSHIISCILVGLLFRNWKNEKKIFFYEKKVEKEKSNVSIKDFGEILGKSISSSILTIVNIGGFIVIFSVIISILNSSCFFGLTGKIFDIINVPKSIGNSIISGFIELTNGLKTICLLNITKLNICLISFLIGFGGLSVLFQVYSIISKENISIKPYIYGKILQAFFSFAITGILLSLLKIC